MKASMAVLAARRRLVGNRPRRHLRLVPAVSSPTHDLTGPSPSDDAAWLSAWAKSVRDAHTDAERIPSLADFHNGNQGAAAGSSMRDARRRLQEEK